MPASPMASLGLQKWSNSMSRARDFANLISSGVLADGQISFAEITGVTASATEINHLAGVTSGIQSQFTGVQSDLATKVGTSFTGDVNITGEMLVDSYNETFKRVSSVTAISASTNTTDWSYESKSFSTSSQAIQPNGVTFNNDGTKMYVSDNNTDYLYQYTLSTAYDASTASYDNKRLNFNFQFAGATQIQFNANGTKLFALDFNGSVIYQYGLTTAYDVSTGSYDSVTFSVHAQGANSYGMYFTSDGTKLYIQSNADASNRNINQYTLTTGFDLSTASYANKQFNTASETGSKGNLVINSSGTAVYVLNSTANKIQHYTLSTAFDISTASATATFDLSSQNNNPWGLFLTSNNQKIYTTDRGHEKVWQYETVGSTTSTTFDCEDANVFDTILDANTTVVFSNPPAAGSATDSTAYGMSLKVIQDSGASGYTITWPTSVKWPAATAPTLTATASAVDQFVFYTKDAGTTWYGFTAGQAIA